MRKLFNLPKAVYKGYQGDGERHSIRGFFMILIAGAIALSSKGLDDSALSTIGVMVSVLAGFSFTALFSTQSHSTNDLPPASCESDRLDILNLNILFKNFRDRARYFLCVSVICLFLVFILSVSFSFFMLSKLLDANDFDYIGDIAHVAWSYGCTLVRFSAIFLFLEILYSFYRLAETIFSILDLRRSYLEAAR